MAAAEFRGITVERHTLEYALDDAEEYWRRWVEAPSAVTAAALAALLPEELDRVHAEAIATLEGCRRDGEIRLPSEAVYVTAVRRYRDLGAGQATSGYRAGVPTTRPAARNAAASSSRRSPMAATVRWAPGQEPGGTVAAYLP